MSAMPPIATELTRMGWTGRAPAPKSSQSTRGLCQEKEHHDASHVHGSRSNRYRNRHGQEHASHGRLNKPWDRDPLEVDESGEIPSYETGIQLQSVRKAIVLRKELIAAIEEQ